MRRVFIDSNVPMYAGGRVHPLQVPSQRVIRAAAAGELDAVTDAEVLQEILYRYLLINEREKGFRIFDAFRRLMWGRVLAVQEEDVQRARELAEVHVALSPRDLIHLAVMERHRVLEIVTADRGFDAIPAIRRIDPAEFA